jgi:hypothetical protein
MDIIAATFGSEGYYDSIELRSPPNALSRASKNWIPYGDGGLLRAWKGLSSPGRGSRTMFPFRSGWAGLDDVVVGMITTFGRGNVFSSFFGMCVFAGSGQLIIDGTQIAGAIASSIVRLLLRWNGSYTDPLSGPYTAGISEPNPPQVSQTLNASSIVPNSTGPLSFKIGWYRKTTFGRSRASGTSATLTLNGTAPILTIPLAPTGATHLAIFAPKLGLAQRGLHYRLTRPNPYGTQGNDNLEFKETDIQRTVAVGVTNGTKALTAPVGTFTSADIGKRVSRISGAGTVANPTTIADVTDSANAILSQNATATGAMSASIVAYAGGVDRSVLVNYSEADLAAEVAWIDDFIPPSVSHVFQLEKVFGYVTGGDASSGVSTANGSVIQWSNKNYPESVNPFWRTYLPDSVVDVLERGIDSYVFVGLKTMIIAFQYVETIDTAPATGAVLLQNAGILSPTNWCLRERFLYVFTGNGDLIRIGEHGVVDRKFSAPIRKYLKTFANRANVVLQSDGNECMMVAYGDISLTYNEERGSWSTRLRCSDYAAGNVIAGVVTETGLKVTVEGANAFPRTAYDFDKTTPFTYTVAATDFQSVAERFPAVLNEIFANVKTDTPNSTLYLGLHRNYQPIAIESVNVTRDANPLLPTTVVLNAAGFDLTSDHLGYYLIIQGFNTDALGYGYWACRITQVINATTCKVEGFLTEDLLAPIHDVPPADIAGAYAVFAYKAFRTKPTKAGIREVVNQTVYYSGCYSNALSITMATNHSGEAQPLNCLLAGEIDTFFNGTLTP